VSNPRPNKPQPDVAHPGRPRSGLNYSVARTLDEVVEAWQLVYDAYHRDDLIDANPFRLHTVPQAIGPQTSVVLGCLGPLPVSTVSAYTDGPAGLPLDTVYHAELQQARAAGRKIMEVGLFADRREHLNRAAEGLFELMRFVYYFALYLPVDDVVIGVHPRHVPFYTRFFGFEQAGGMRNYPTVKDRPAVLLRFDMHSIPGRQALPKGLAYFVENPVPSVLFDKRFEFAEGIPPESPLRRFLTSRASASATTTTAA
jgi:hypothetical protein